MVPGLGCKQVGMNAWNIIPLSVFEIAALIVITRLWMQRRVRIVPRLFWSVMLLVPFFGLILYLFLHEDPEAHPYRSGDSGWNVGSDDGGHSGGGHGGH